MSRVALTETVLLSTNPASFARGLEVYVYDRGTTNPATVHAQEIGGPTVTQPLLTDRGGTPRDDESLCWVDAGSYDLLIAGQTVPWEAADGQGGGGGAGVATHSFTEDFGAESGANTDDAWDLAAETLTTGDVLLCPKDPAVEGPTQYKMTPTGPGLALPDGVTVLSPSRKSIELVPEYSGSSRVRMFGPEGHTEFRDISFRMDSSIDRSAEVQCIFGQSTNEGAGIVGATHIGVERVDFLGGFAMCVDASLEERTDIFMRDFVIDGENAGLSSGQNRKVVMGIAHNSIGIFSIELGKFTGLGSNATGKPFDSHCIYVAPNTTLRATDCRFEDHIVGRLIQFYNGFQTEPLDPIGDDHILRCIFGLYHEGTANPNHALETSKIKRTVYRDCHVAAIYPAGGSTVIAKGPDSAFPGTVFESPNAEEFKHDPSAYIGVGEEAEEFPESGYDATDAIFDGVKYEGTASSGTDIGGLTGNWRFQSMTTGEGVLKTTPTSGVHYARRFTPEEEIQVFEVEFVRLVLGETLTNEKCYSCIYDGKTGERLWISSSQHINFTEATGTQKDTMVIGGGGVLWTPDRDFWVTLLVTGTTMPKFAGSGDDANAASANADMGTDVGGEPRCATIPLTSGKPQSTLGARTPTGKHFLIGLRGDPPE